MLSLMNKTSSVGEIQLVEEGKTDGILIAKLKIAILLFLDIRTLLEEIPQLRVVFTIFYRLKHKFLTGQL